MKATAVHPSTGKLWSARGMLFSWHITWLLCVFCGFGAAGFLPLLGGPGYEHALLAGLLLPSGVAVVAAREGGTASPLVVLGRGIQWALLVVLAALLPALLHGLRLGFCDLPGELLWFALTAGGGILLAGIWGALVGLCIPHTRPWTRTLLALAAPLGSMGRSAWGLYASPRVFAFDPFVGLFQGAVYDTELSVSHALWSYRLGSLLTVSGVALVVSSLVRREGHLALRPEGGRTALWLGLFSMACSFGFARASNREGYGHTSESIAQALGGAMHGGRCTVLYPKAVPTRRATLLLQDCEEQLAEVEATLQMRGPVRITVFFFQDLESKRQLTGAGRTSIAKPWRREAYVQLEEYPHPLLGHELAHVVTGEKGQGPLRVAGGLGGFLPNPGLIEGTAVFAAPDEGVLTPTQTARALLKLGRLPPLPSLFSVQFWGGQAEASYAVAGAFVQWIVEHHGIQTLHRWYSGEALPQLTKSSWRDLEKAFRTELAHETLPAELLAYARAKYTQPGIVGRRCPHAVDTLQRDAARCFSSGQFAEAEELYSHALAHEPQHMALRYETAMAKLHSDLEPGRAQLQALASNPATPPFWQARAREGLADQLWREGQAHAAAMEYQRLMSTAAEEESARRLEVKALAAEEDTPVIRDVLLRTHERDDGPAYTAARLSDWAHENTSPLAAYLFARSLQQQGLFLVAAPYLDRVINSPLPLRLRREAFRLQAVGACAAGGEADRKRMEQKLHADTTLFANAPSRKMHLARLLARCQRNPHPLRAKSQ